MGKRQPPDETVTEIEQMVEATGVPKEKRKEAVGLWRLFVVKKMSQAQVRGARIAKDELRKNK